MRTLRAIGSIVVVAASLTACLDGQLSTEPPTILTDEQIWSNPQLIASVMSNFYGRLPDFMSINGTGGFTSYDEALASGNTAGDGVNQLLSYPYSTAAAWQGSYTLIRDINVALENIETSTAPLITPARKLQYNAELRFMRAWVYFDLVKRMGGVPLVTEQLIYDFNGDPSYLQMPRSKEAEVYDFIASELDAIAPNLGNAGSVSAANRYTALALKSRAMLYAASIARYNNELGVPVTLPGEIVGIPASRANEYFTKALDASKLIIDSGIYSLYRKNADPGANFYEALTSKAANPEVIWVKDYSVAGGVTHNWTLNIVPPSLRIDVTSGNNGANISPSLQIVETFDFLDGSAGTLRGVGTGSNTAAGQANWIFYNQPEDIFAGKDGRLAGTILYPGSSARGGQVQIQAGVYIWNSTTNKYDRLESGNGTKHTDGGVLTGLDGPRGVQAALSPTGFYPRKYMDSNPAGGTSATGSDIWWIRFRLGEIYLNAAEAAFELGLTGEALGYMNTLRQRAGFPANSLTTLTRNKIRSERWAELYFEDHRFWDVKRWRTAHILWDGTAASTTANVYALWGYRVIHPGHPNDGKYVYDKFPAVRQTRPRYWQMGNYYSEIPAAALNSNPKLIRNPFH